MDIRTLEDAAINDRGGQRSYLLAGPDDSSRVMITWIASPCGTSQPVHRHEHAEQVYVVVRGCGRMTVAGETAEVGPGTLIRVPPGTDHAIQGLTVDPLTVVTATAPPFPFPVDSPFQFTHAR